MTEKPKIHFSWSGGKDSAFALWKLAISDQWNIAGLHTTIDAASGKSGLHEIPIELLQKQADALQLPFDLIPLSKDESYEDTMLGYYQKLAGNGISHIAMGDIFLEDLRKYKEAILAKAGLTSLFPLWQQNTREMAREVIATNFHLIICSADADLLPDAAGSLYNQSFIDKLPTSVDPCGENGEFHSFCFDGPIFYKAVSFQKGEIETRNFEFHTDDNKLIKRRFSFLELY
ncbi:Dph6-related ATP pyrophosphatase [Peijinzhouia sedimentorum]